MALNRMPDKPQDLIAAQPVSYTHLDVYKRQVVDDVQQSFPVMMAKALGGDGFTTPIDPSEDVYKRQFPHRALLYFQFLIPN